MTAFSGGCLCGTVRYEGTDPQGGGHCYCNDCRHTSGTSHGSHMIVAEDNIVVNGELRFFDAPADSGNLVSRGFCPTCGSAVMSRNSGMPGMAFVRASSLDDPEVFAPQIVVFASRAPSWSQPDAKLTAFAEMPPPQDMPDDMNH